MPFLGIGRKKSKGRKDKPSPDLKTKSLNSTGSTFTQQPTPSSSASNSTPNHDSQYLQQASSKEGALHSSVSPMAQEEANHNNNNNYATTAFGYGNGGTGLDIQTGRLPTPPLSDATDDDVHMADQHNNKLETMKNGLLTPDGSLPNRSMDVDRNNIGQQQQQQQQPMSAMSQTLPQNTLKPTTGKYKLVDFSIQRTLGTGSFGRVHLVQSRHNQRFYAIKVLKKVQVVKMKQIEHTNDERTMLQRVKHPFLVNLWGTFQDSKNLYMVMDFIEGGELFSLLRKSQRFPNPVAKFYAAEVTLALDYLHSLDIIYRDLKPENLLLDRHGHIKITDFGFAKRCPDITWTLCGTPDYLAPEVVASKGYNKSVDWWSLGILTFEMLAGYPPFYDQSPMKLYENIIAGHVRYPSYFDPQAKDLLSKLLTADLSKRFGNLSNGSKDVMTHPWFTEVNWERLARREIDSPYQPPVRGSGDASLFDKYAEDTEEYGDMSSHDPFRTHFPDF